MRVNEGADVVGVLEVRPVNELPGFQAETKGLGTRSNASTLLRVQAACAAHWIAGRQWWNLRQAVGLGRHPIGYRLAHDIKWGALRR